MAYSTDADLLKIRPNILSLGVDAWADQHTEADAILTRSLELWYKQEAAKRCVSTDELDTDYTEIEFDADKLLNASTQLKRLSCYKTLELAYLYLMQDGEAVGEGYNAQRKLFADMYEREWKAVVDAGIDYDWDDDGSIDYTESTPYVRGLVRA